MGRKKHTRVDKINKLGEKDHFMPVDLSRLSKAVVRKKFRKHPLEQYEQLMSDLFLKGLLKDIKLQRAARNYISQTHNICENCTYPNYDSNDLLSPFCYRNQHMNPLCRVYQFRNQWLDLLSEIEVKRYQAKDKSRILIKKSTLKGYKRNRWNWKKQALGIIENKEGVLTNGIVHKIPQSQTN